jgi:hypothetical protein
MSAPPKPAATIAALNDAFRAAGPNGDWVVTIGVKSRGDAFVDAVVRKVRAHACFPADDDPHGERDFGAITLDCVRVWFKIDYFDRDRVFGSDDPADPKLTRRVLTILLPDEW